MYNKDTVYKQDYIGQMHAKADTPFKKPNLLEIRDGVGIYEQAEVQEMRKNLDLICNYGYANKILYDKRNSLILKKNFRINKTMLNKEIYVYNGVKLESIVIDAKKVGCRIGQFIRTKRLLKHLFKDSHRADRVSLAAKIRARARLRIQILEVVEEKRKLREEREKMRLQFKELKESKRTKATPTSKRAQEKIVKKAARKQRKREEKEKAKEKEREEEEAKTREKEEKKAQMLSGDEDML